MRLFDSPGFGIALLVGCAISSQLAFGNVTVLHDGSAPDDVGGTILIHSEIKKGDFTDFQKAADHIKSVEKDAYKPVPLIRVELDSPGGDVMEAVRIGHLVHERFMRTFVMPERECASACVFILAAGVMRVPTPKAHVAVHRPKFDPTYFVALGPEEARTKYNSLVADLRRYYIDEMNGDEEAFRLMMSTPSDQVRALTYDELQRLGLAGEDPAWDEYEEAEAIKKYGPVRNAALKTCISHAKESNDVHACFEEVFAKYPTKQ